MLLTTESRFVAPVARKFKPYVVAPDIRKSAILNSYAAYSLWGTRRVKCDYAAAFLTLVFL